MENRTPVKAARNPYLTKETEKDPKLGVAENHNSIIKEAYARNSLLIGSVENEQRARKNIKSIDGFHAIVNNAAWFVADVSDCVSR